MKVPESWGVKPGFTVVNERKEKNIGLKEKRVLSLSYGKVIIKPEEKLTGLVPESFETYQLVFPGDVIIRPTDLQNDHTSLRTGLAKDQGIITSAYINLRVKNGNSRFYHYFLHAIDLNKVLYGLGSGLRQNIDFSDFKRFPFVSPPPAEQTAIADFLDDKTAKIDKAIAQKERLIALLKERKQILIQNAVTKGLDPSAKMKDSGIEWIGEIPEHWRIGRLKEVFQLIRTGTTPSTSNPDHFDGDVNWFNPGDLNEFIPVDPTKTITAKAISRNEAKLFPGDSVMIVGIGATCGKTSYLTLDSSFNQQITGFHSKNHSNLYLAYSLRAFAEVMLRVASYTTLPILNNQFFGNFSIPVPPLEEQEKLISWIESSSGKFENAIRQATQSIQTLREYRATLIDSAVTGKIKVPGI